MALAVVAFLRDNETLLFRVRHSSPITPESVNHSPTLAICQRSARAIPDSRFPRGRERNDNHLFRRVNRLIINRSTGGEETVDDARRDASPSAGCANRGAILRERAGPLDRSRPKRSRSRDTLLRRTVSSVPGEPPERALREK